MIKIQEHLNRPDADDYLDSLAVRLWDFFNEKLADQSDYKKYSLIKRLDRLIVQSDNPDYLLNIAKNDNNCLQRQKRFYDFLKNGDYAKLKELIVSRPEKLVALKVEILNILQVDDLYSLDNGIKQTSFGKLLVEEIFIYR